MPRTIQRLRGRVRRPPAPLDRSDPIVSLKLDLLEAATPARDAIVFGDVWGVHGAYSLRCLQLGCRDVHLVDSLQTPEFQERLAGEPRLHYIHGDFSDPVAMAGMQGAEIGVAYDVLLHQGPLTGTIHLLLEKCERAICISQPMLVEQPLPASVVYLPGNLAQRELSPSYSHLEGGGTGEINVFDVKQVNHGHWLWGMTRSFIENVLIGEGFEIVHERRGPDLANPNWYLWGCVAERRARNPDHWGASQAGSLGSLPRD